MIAESTGIVRMTEARILERMEKLIEPALNRLEEIINDDTGAIKPETQMKAVESVLARFVASKLQATVDDKRDERDLDDEIAPYMDDWEEGVG